MSGPLPHLRGPLAALLLLLAVPASFARAEEWSSGCPCPSQASVTDRWFVQAEAHGSVLSDASDRSVLGDTIGYALRVGKQYCEWGFFAQAEQNLWFSHEIKNDLTAGAANIGLGVQYLYFEGRARASLAVGPSILLSDTVIDDAGEVGIFGDIRPTGLRFELGDDVVLSVDPLTFTVVAPVLSGIPLTLVEFRTVLTLEVDL